MQGSAARRVVEPDLGELVPGDDLLDHRFAIELEIGEGLGGTEEQLAGLGSFDHAAEVTPLVAEHMRPTTLHDAGTSAAAVRR